MQRRQVLNALGPATSAPRVSCFGAPVRSLCPWRAQRAMPRLRCYRRLTIFPCIFSIRCEINRNRRFMSTIIGYAIGISSRKTRYWMDE